MLTRDGTNLLPYVVDHSYKALLVSDIIIHDFDDVFSNPFILAGRRFHEADRSERLLNVDTFVVDLTLEDDDILAQMSSDFRRKIRRAASLGVNVDIYQSPPSGLINDFCAAFSVMARERGLRPINSKVLARMYAAGDAVLFVARIDNTRANYLHVYKTQDSAIFSHGVNATRNNDGVGQYIQWRAMQYLKKQGIEWYDLGGVPTTNPNDGIYNFKARFGGKLIPLGREWRNVRPPFTMLGSASLSAFRLTERLSSGW